MTYKDGSWGKKAKIRSKNRNAYFRNYQKTTIRLFKKKILEKYGSKCNNCGFSDIRILQIDHINNDGNKERRMKMSSWGYYHKVLMDKNNKYQLLCPNCNWFKRLKLTKEGGEIL